jgi:glucoamylase
MAPGAPGLPPTWCSSDKDLVGTAMGPARLWFTLGHGIVNEVYHPRIDIPQIRDLGFIVADGAGFWVEVKRLEAREILTPGPGIPLPTIHHRHARFTLSLRVCPDPERDVLRLSVELDGDAELRPYVLLAPHLGGTGLGNQAWVGEHRGRRALWAEQGPFGLALMAVDSEFGEAFSDCSVGYVGASDGWHDFASHGRMSWRHTQAGPGNVALMGELPRRAQLALGISTSRESAATLALASLTESFEAMHARQIQAWSDWHAARAARCPPPPLPDDLERQLRLSAQVLKSHQDKTFSGAMVASLSVPWGNHGEERGGYHLVWPRDLVECAQSLLALGSQAEARAVLTYLIASQHADGHWHQNQWLGGKAYWEGIQLDESAFPVLLATSLAEADALADMPVVDMVRRALGFLIREGPASPQDRWEENAGVNPFTVAVAIAALVAGAEFLPEAERALPWAVADFWNARIEDWCVARGTALGAAHGVSAYYVRQTPPDVLISPKALHRVLPIKNLDRDPNLPASEQVGL